MPQWGVISHTRISGSARSCIKRVSCITRISIPNPSTCLLNRCVIIFIEISERESNYSIIAISRSEEHIVDNYIFIIRIIYICQLKRSSSNCRIPAKVCGYLDISGKSRVRIRPITAMMSFLVRSISPSCMYSTTLWNRFSSRLYSTKKSSNRLFWNIFHRGESSKSTA